MPGIGACLRLFYLLQEGAQEIDVHRVLEPRIQGHSQDPDRLLPIERQPVVHPPPGEVAGRAFLLKHRSDLSLEVDPGRGRGGGWGWERRSRSPSSTAVL